MVSDLDTIARQFAEIAIEASTAIMLARAGIGSATFKSDGSPVTAATMEWDAAAGDAVLRAAGGSVLYLTAAPFRYGKPDYRNGSFVAWSLPSDDPAASPPALLL
jgi:3'-phosphoadenosine 5'-phosphosulfate (PAPS) 3'-phosphatase